MQEVQIYRLVFEHSVQGMVLRQGGETVLVNQSFADMVGYTIDELRGFSFEESLLLIHPQDRDWVLASLRDSLAGRGLPNQCECQFVRRNGQTGWWSATMSLIEYEGQQAVLGTYIDITERKRIEESLQRERQFLVDILNALPIGVCLTDETGHYRIVNDSYCQTYDFEREDIVGKHYSTIMPPDQIELANRHYARLLAGDLGIPVERKRQRKDGSIVYIEAANALVKRPDGQTMVITVVRDVNERKQMENSLRASEERFRTVVDEAPIAILLVTPAGEVKLANRQAEILFGYDANGLENLALEQLLTLENRNVHRQHVQDFFRSAPQGHSFVMATERDVYGLRSDKTQFPADITLGHIRLQDDQMALAFVIDATARLELERQRLALHLEQERSAILSSFMQNAAHEFRTPLTVIKAGIFLLNNARTAEDKDRYNGQIMAEIAGLVRLVSQLTLISRLSHVEATRAESIELNQLIDHAIVANQAQCDARQIEVHTESDHDSIYLVGDHDDLIAGFSELLDNAIRYSAEGSRIRLHLGIAEQNQAVITIQDSGGGMSEETQRRAFERFYREDSAHSTRGFGLGLPIAKHVFELHGGSIQLESALNVGTTVRVALPFVSLQPDQLDNSGAG